MPRGGSRTGKPGTAYSNRTDLAGKVPAMTAPGQTYGKAAAQMAAQRAIPIAAAPQSPTPQAPQGAPGGMAPPGPPMPTPADVPSLSDPSTRPGEPVTAGLPVGAGPGLEALGALGQAGSEQDVAMALRAAYEAFPSEDLRMILERLDLDGRQV